MDSGDGRTMKNQEEDTAKQVASLEDCLYSSARRIEIAGVLSTVGRKDLLPTILEDLYCGVQLILDNYCVKED